MIDTLIDKIKKTENPTVVGLDPRLSFIPGFIKEECIEKFGKTPKAVAESFLAFNKAVIDAVYDLIPAVKPQIAMYEMLGVDGIDCFIKTCEYASDKGLAVIGDIKRGDIASTAEAYSDGHIGMIDVEGVKHNIFHEDFITVNPYLGWDSIEPYLSNCREFEKGLFVLVKTSNPNSGQLQDLDIGGLTLYQKVGKLVEEWGEGLRGKYGYSSIGAVVGATHPDQAKNLRQIMPHTFFLVPGYGAQGGKAEDLAVCFDSDGLGAIVNSSRGIIAAYKKEQYRKFGEKEFALAARQAVVDMKADLRRCLK
ncbi:orotidine-5'-phosphate decarboxylase [Lachnospiraceae bacterium NSJ-143]|nr:orotidine-5'-phosphate decarboxylase [Lachnospiraceae bacterium NSJ-143]